MNFVAVERRDKGLVQQLDGGLRDPVRLFFNGLDGVGTALDVIPRRHQRGQFTSALNNQLGVLVEQIKKLRFLGHETAKHGTPLLATAWQLSDNCVATTWRLRGL